MFKENSNSIILEILEILRPKLEKLVSKLEFKLKKGLKLELNMHSKWNSMKLEFVEKLPVS